MKFRFVSAFLLSTTFSFHATEADAIPAAFVIAQLGVTGALATAATYFAVGLANFGLSRLLTNAIGTETANPGIKTQVTTEGGTTGQNLILGLTATKGNLTAPMYAGGETNTYDNADRFTILDIADKPVTDVTAIWVDGNKLTPADFAGGDWTSNGDGQGVAVSNQNSIYKDNLLKVRLFKGNQTTAAQGLVDMFGTHAKRPWTAAMIGKGVAYMHLRFRYDDDTYRGEPQVLFEVKGSALYDPRKDGTRGGTGGHRLNNEATWEYSANPKVMQYNILLGIPMPDGTTFGLDVDPDDLPLDEWVADMNKCDEDANGEPRYTAGIDIRIGLPEHGGTTPLDAIDKLNAACDGEVADIGGVWYTRCGGPDLPVMDIEDGDLLRNQDVDLRPFPETNERFTGVRTVFVNPNKQWKTTESPLRTDADALASEGEPRIAKLVLDAVYSRRQAQRLGRALLKDSMRRRVHRIVLGPHASHLKPFQTMRWQSGENGYTNKLFMIEKKSVDPLTLDTTLVLRERDNSDYDWVPADELPEEAVSTDKRTPAMGPIPGAGFQQFRVKDDGGTERRAAIRAVWTPPVLGVRTIQMVVRNKVSGEVIFRGTTQDLEEGAHEIGAAIVPGATYEGRMRGLRRKTDWTPWLTVVAPDVKLKRNDIADGEITDEKILGMSVTKFQGLIQDAQMAGISASKLQGLVQSAQVNTLDAVKLIGSIPKERIVAVPVGSLDGQLADAQIAGLSASKLAGLIADTNIPPINVSKLEGQIADANIAGLSASKLAGLIADTQIQTLSASKLSGLVQSAQINTVDAQKLFGTVAEARIAALSAAKITGQITGVQITDNAISAPKILAGAITAGKIATDAVTANTIVAGAVGADQIAADAISARHIVLGNNGTVLTAAFGYDTELDDWYNHSGAGELEVRTTTSAQFGGKVLKIGNRSGDDQVWMHYKRLFPYDPNKLYRVTVRVYRASSDNGSFYFGFDGFNEAKNRCNASGLDSWSAQHYFVAAGQHPNGWTEYVGYVKGHGGGREGAGTNSIDNPSTMHANVRYWAPMFIANYANQPGITEIDYVTVEEVIPGELIVNGAITGDKVSARTIDAGKIATGTLTANEIKGRTITAAEIVTGTIGANEIASRTITAVKIDSGTLTSNEISSRAINADRIAVGALTATEIKGRTITAATIATNAITSNEINARTIVAGNLVAGTVTAYEIKGRTITANEIAVGTLTANEIAAEAIGANQIAANAITAKQLLLTDFSNMIVNDWQGGNIEGWVASGSTGSLGINTSANIGTYSWRSKERDQIYSRDVIISEGETYYFSVWVYNYEPAYNANILFRIVKADGSGLTFPVVATTGLKNQWHRIEGQYTVPAGYTSGKMFLQVPRTGTGTQFTYWAKPVMRRASGGELIVDGAITAAKILANEISGTHIKGRTITAGNIVSGSITGNEINGRTITAGHIASGTLTANEINVGTITIETANIRNLAVETVKIAGGAVVTGKVTNRNITNYAWNFYAGSKFGSSGTETQVCNATISPSNDGNLHVQYSMELDTPDRDFSIRIRQNGFEIYRATHTSADSNTANSGSIVSGSIIFSGNTSQTFELTVNIFPEGGSGTVENRFLSVTELMK